MSARGSLDDERHATSEVGEVFGGDVVHRLRPIKRDVGAHVAVDEDLACELTGAGAEFEDADLCP